MTTRTHRPSIKSRPLMELLNLLTCAELLWPIKSIRLACWFKNCNKEK